MDFDRVANLPIEIMRVPVQDPSMLQVRHEKALKAAALPMRRAVEWMAGAAELDARLAAADAGKGDAQAALQAVLEYVLAYDPAWPAEAVREHASGPQIVNAFYLLRELNDPFAVAKSKKREEEERGLRMFEALAKAGNPAVNSLIEKHLREASADSEKSSVLTPGKS